MSIVRKKAVTIDGAEFVIGSLTMRQVETIVAWSPEGKTVGELKTRAINLVINSFTNAEFMCEAQPWTPERNANEIDSTSFDFMQTEILSWSKLTVVKTEAGVGGVPAAGEAPAAPQL